MPPLVHVFFLVHTYDTAYYVQRRCKEFLKQKVSRKLLNIPPLVFLFLILFPFAILHSTKKTSLLFPQVGWFSKGGIEEKEGENVLSFFFLTESQVKFRGLTLASLLEKDP